MLLLSSEMQVKPDFLFFQVRLWPVVLIPVQGIQAGWRTELAFSNWQLGSIFRKQNISIKRTE